MVSKEQTSAHILVVDDDDIVRTALHQNLSEAGFILSEAENGVQAIKMLGKQRPDIILMDVMMPEMDGFAATEAIRRLAGFKNIPILILTCLEDIDSINRAYKAGATDFITKPINWVILVERIRFIMRTIQLMNTEQKLRRELVQAQKMEALGTLAGGVAHDLNNVLSGIIGYPEMLLWKLDEDSPLREPLKEIRTAGQQAAEIVDDLLTLARRGVSVKNTINLNDIISEYLNSPEYKKLISYHQNVRVEVYLDSKLDNFEGSSIHIRKTIMNLVANAVEAQPMGGTICISTCNQDFNVNQKEMEQGRKGEHVVFQISDQGCGIPQEDLNRIFEPFFTKKIMGRSGTGLGMAVVWGTVQDHYGHVEVKSRPNQGTTFTLYFPATTAEKKEETPTIPIDDYKGDGQAILIIDDIKEQRQFATTVLKTLNYAPTAVSSGEEAVEYLKTHSADLIMLDMIMSADMDGLETYKKILEIKPGQKAIVASGFSESDRVKQVQQLGAGPFIKKPYSLETIGLAIKNALN